MRKSRFTESSTIIVTQCPLLVDELIKDGKSVESSFLFMGQVEHAFVRAYLAWYGRRCEEKNVDISRICYARCYRSDKKHPPAEKVAADCAWVRLRAAFWGGLSFACGSRGIYNAILVNDGGNFQWKRFALIIPTLRLI